MDDSTSQIVLFADFDSANMAKYEKVAKTPASLLNTILAAQYTAQTTSSPKLVSSTSSTTTTETSETPTSSTNSGNVITNNFVTQKFDVEFNVWTKPDCDDSPVGPNSNRTWFYFGVKGGHGKFLKFNLMNLNKQSKLFEMGMLPVFKTVPGHEKWARIYLKPIWQTVDQNFTMSFIHRIPDKRDSVTYFAFCFPFSYDECQSMLDKYDEQFRYCQHDLTQTDKYDPDTIYYHRELLAHSLDKRRLDLLTISSYTNITGKREPRFDPDVLFPDGANVKRCFKFDKKRVFVLTSRVHPGETPASFVFNGFLEFILRPNDPRAKILRRQFVFKLLPMLNPDGVARGYYRTDQMGVNLNRVYLDPNPRWHPTIYAAKSLIVFHHIYNRSSRDLDALNFEHVFKLEYEKEEEFERNG